MANPAKLTAQEYQEAFESFSLDDQLQIFEGIRIILRDKKQEAQLSYQKLQEAQVEQNGGK